MKAGNQTLLKKNNQRAIIDYIIQNGPISRADLSKKLKISKPTVSANVAELIDMHLLREIGYSETDIGKKPMLVDFDKDFRFVLALDFISYIAINKVSVAVCNLYCDPIFIDTINLPPDFDANFIKKNLPKSIMELFKRYNVSMDKIAKMVISAPTVWYDDDHVNFECRTGEIVNLSEIFKPYFKNRIVVKNDINLAALGEKYFGVGKDVDTLFFAWISIGVGGGIILDGELYEGKALNGGELAYSTVYNEDLDRFEYFRDITDMNGIRRYIQSNHKKAETSLIADQLLDGTFTLDMMIKASLQGDIFCSRFAKHVGKITAVLLSNLSSVIDLEMIIVGGDYARFGDVFLNEIRIMTKDIPTTKVAITAPEHSNSAMYGAFKFGAEHIISKLI